MKGKDLSEPSVIRHFRRILNTALFALVLSFSVNFAFGGGTCNAPIYAGTYCYTASTTNANAPVSINTCPSGCFCPLRISGSVTAITTTGCNSINPGYSYTGSEIGGNAYRCPKSFTLSASGSDSANDCYTNISAGYYYDITADSGGISNVTNAQCPAGYYCPGMTLSYGNAVNGIYGRTECPANTYNPNKRETSNSACIACATNATSPAGSAYCTCKTGYSIGGGTTGAAYSTSDPSGSTCTEISASGCAADEVYDEDTGICHEPCGENEYWNGTNCVLNTFNVVYANGGGSGSDPTTPTSCTYNGTCNAPSNPYVRSDYIFEGWECTSSSGSCTKSTYLPNESISGATNVNGATITLTAKWHTFSESDCPLYENTDEADTEHYKYNSYGTRQVGIYRYYILGSRYKQADNEISRCQVFFNVDNSLIPHTATDISGYTHTMVRVAYSVADINTNGYTANKYNYNRGAQIQFNGVNNNIRLHCASGYANKQAESGMIFYPTLAEALANACTKVEENHYVDDGVTELSCPNEYPHSLGNGGKTSCYANLTFVYNNGTNDETREIYYTASSSNGYKITNLPAPNRNGFSFGGWYTSANFTGDAINANTVFSNGDQTLYAKWVCEPGYTLNTTTNVCEPCAPGTYKSTGGDESCTACAVGSYTNTTGATSCIACQNGTTTSGPGLTSCNAICENNAHVSVWENATWTDNSVSNLCAINKCDNYYYITNEMCAHINIQLSYIDSMDNSVIETTPQICTYNEAFNLPDTPTRIGYKFTGWELVE